MNDEKNFFKALETIRNNNKRIKELEEENACLKAEVERLKKTQGGRSYHDEKWQKLYKTILTYYDNGMSVNDIAKELGISRRTVFRYLTFHQTV